MPKQAPAVLSTISLFTIAALVFLLPLFFLPVTTEFYDTQKFTLLILGSILLVFLWLGRMILEKRVHIVISPVLAPVAAFTLASLLSLAISSPNKVEPILSAGSTGSLVVLLFFTFILTNLIGVKKGGRQERIILYAASLSAVVLATISITFFLGLTASLPVAEFIKDKAFTPAGSLLTLLTFLVVVLVWIGSTLMDLLGLSEDNEDSDVLDQMAQAWNDTALKDKSTFIELIGLGLAFFVILIGAGIILYTLTTTSKPTLLPVQFGWQIAVETLKDFRTAVFGVGPTNFLSAYTRFRPLALNSTDLWATRFTNSSNAYFFYFTTTGIFGLATYLFIAISIYAFRKRESRDHKSAGGITAIVYAIYTIFFITALVPGNFLLLFLLFLLTGILGTYLKPVAILEESTVITPIILSVLIFAAAAGIIFYGSRFYRADMLFRNSLQAAIANRGVDVYNLQAQAINLNPYQDVYRATYAQTNLALATSLSQRAIATGSGQLTDQERQTVTTLIEQSIREAKAAVSLNAERVTNWENLGQIYRSLINIAAGSDAWSIQVYQQAITLDPTNPDLRLTLGGIYYALHLYDEAARQFELAAVLKPNQPNALYNLAAALREKKDYAKAYQTMQMALSALPPDSADRAKVTQELDALKSLLPQPASEASPAAKEQTITPPLPAPTGLKHPIALPSGSAPAISVTPQILKPSPSPSTTIEP